MEKNIETCAKCGSSGPLYVIPVLNHNHSASRFCAKHFVERGYVLPVEEVVEDVDEDFVEVG